jgi:hypothetical protein
VTSYADYDLAASIVDVARPWTAPRGRRLPVVA